MRYRRDSVEAAARGTSPLEKIAAHQSRGRLRGAIAAALHRAQNLEKSDYFQEARQEIRECIKILEDEEDRLRRYQEKKWGY